jgi:hypothetical protein
VRHGRRAEHGHSNNTVRLRSVTNTDDNSTEPTRHHDESGVAVAELWHSAVAVDHAIDNDRHYFDYWYDVDNRSDDNVSDLKHAAVDHQPAGHSDAAAAHNVES